MRHVSLQSYPAPPIDGGSVRRELLLLLRQGCGHTSHDTGASSASAAATYTLVALGNRGGRELCDKMGAAALLAPVSDSRKKGQPGGWVSDSRKERN